MGGDIISVDGAPVRILAVCTANISRSPAVERLLRAGLDGTVEVGSAGVSALVGDPIDPPVARFLEAHGADASDFAARQVDDQLLAEADLVLTLTRAQRARVLELAPSAVRRTFTLREFARVLDSLDLSGFDPNLSVGERLRAILPLATAGRALAPSAGLDGDDVPDPYGMGAGGYDRALGLITEATEVVVRHAQGFEKLDQQEGLDERVVAGRPRAARRRLVLRVLAPVLGLLALILAWGGWQLWQLGSPLLGLRDVAGQAQLHVKAGELAALSGDLARARQLAAEAGTAADAPAVAFAAGLPWVGDDVTVARELARAAADLGAGMEGVDPLLQRVAGGASPNLLVASDAREVIGQVRAAADKASTRLERLDLGGLALPVGDDITRLRTGLGKVGPAVDALTPYLNALTILASPGAKHTWFVVMQNLGESRPSGGMIGSWLVVRTTDGKLEVLRKGFNGYFADGSVDYKGYLPAGYEQVFGNGMNDWRSLNASAHFPDDARLFAHAWNDLGEEQVDGVLALGQGTARILAAAAGPVEIKGRSIAPTELADYLMIGVYKDFPDQDEKDAAVAEIIAQILNKLSSGHVDLGGFVEAVLGDPSGDYLQLWSAHPAVQKQVEESGLSGSFTDEPGPVASVRLADAAANKLDAFVHLGVEYQLGECVVDEDDVATRTSTFTVTLRNAVPKGLPDYVTGKGELLDGLKHPVGATRDFVLVYTPVQATVTSALLNGEPALVQSAWVRDRQMLVFDVKLTPGASATINLTWDEFPTDDEDRAFPLTPRIVLPPLANPAVTRMGDAAACR